MNIIVHPLPQINKRNISLSPEQMIQVVEIIITIEKRKATAC